MIVSPRSSSGARPSIVESTNAAGTMIHTWRGGCSWATNSTSDVAPVMPSSTRAPTAVVSMSKPTHW